MSACGRSFFTLYYIKVDIASGTSSIHLWTHVMRVWHGHLFFFVNRHAHIWTRGWSCVGAPLQSTSGYIEENLKYYFHRLLLLLSHPPCCHDTGLRQFFIGFTFQTRKQRSSIQSMQASINISSLSAVSCSNQTSRPSL